MALGFWQLGKIGFAKAFVRPALVAGILLLAIGLGLFYTNRARVKRFAVEHERDAPAFLLAEIVRAEKTVREYDMVVNCVLPLIVVVAALSLLFVDAPRWRAIGIVMNLADVDETEAEALLDRARGNVAEALRSQRED